MHFDKEALVAAHTRNASLRAAPGPDKRQPELGVFRQPPGPGPTHEGSEAELGDLKECGILELSPFLGSRAVRKELFGSFCTEPIRLASVMTILSDKLGTGVQVAFYNLDCIDAGHWRKCFPSGA